MRPDVVTDAVSLSDAEKSRADSNALPANAGSDDESIMRAELIAAAGDG